MEHIGKQIVSIRPRHFDSDPERRGVYSPNADEIEYYLLQAQYRCIATDSFFSMRFDYFMKAKKKNRRHAAIARDYTLRALRKRNKIIVF